MKRMTHLDKCAGRSPLAAVVAAAVMFLVMVDLPAADSVAIRSDDAQIDRRSGSVESYAAAIKAASASVVHIYTVKLVGGHRGAKSGPGTRDPLYGFFFGDPDRPHKERGLGSGVIVSADGYILTNNHVVMGSDEIKVLIPTGKDRHVYDAVVIGTDAMTDVALLKIRGRKFPHITVTNSDKIQVGDVVFAIGNPFGVGQSVTRGIISAVSRGGMGLLPYEDFIQTDASINPGNSGGALVDARGRLVGINTFILSRTGGNQGIGFSIPTNLARSVLESLIAHGRVVRGYLGIHIQVVTPEIAKTFRLKEVRGALVSQVFKGTAADRAGFKRDDVVVSFGRKNAPVQDPRHLRLMVSQTSPGTRTQVTVIRGGHKRKLAVTLIELPVAGFAATAKPVKEPVEVGGLFKGLMMEDVSDDFRAQFQLPVRLTGVLVTDIQALSPAAEAGLKAGDVILEIDRTPVKNTRQAERVRRRVKGDSVVLYVWSRGYKRYVVLKKA